MPLREQLVAAYLVGASVDVAARAGPGDYHIQNYALYYANLRANAIDRVAAFRASRAAHQSPVPEL